MLQWKRFVMFTLYDSLSFLLLCAYVLAQVSLQKINYLVFMITQSNLVVVFKFPMNKIKIQSERIIKEKQAKKFKEFVSFLFLFQHACYKS